MNLPTFPRRLSGADVTVLTLTLVASSCTNSSKADDAGTGLQGQGLGSAPEEPKEPEAVHHVARRCGQCHTLQRAEWAKSAHADAAAGAFALLRPQVAEDQRKDCDGCHVPLAGVGRRIAEEGVTCDACHTAVGAQDASKSVPIQLAPHLATKFGPFRDAKDHNFHRVAYSDFVTGSGLCIACHEDRKPGTFPIYTTVTEWRDSGHSDVSCQSCHMASYRGEAAKGEGERPLSHHHFDAVDRGQALAAAIDVKLSVLRQSKQFEVVVGNAKAGHALPTGAPERRLVLVVELLGQKGKVLAREERVYGRMLVDAAGAPVPRFRAVRQLADTRLRAGEARLEKFILPAGAVRAVADLWFQPIALGLGAELASVRPPILIVKKTKELSR